MGFLDFLKPKPRQGSESVDRPLSPNLAFETRDPYKIGITGEGFKNADGSSRQKLIARCKVGDPVELVREPANPYDKNAIAVFAKGGQLGYLRRDDAAEYAPRLDGGTRVRTSIAHINGGSRDKPEMGVVLWIAWEAKRRRRKASGPEDEG